jgi:hypothetical protein
MADVLEVVYRLRDMAGIAAERLRAEIAAAQAVLDKLDAFADDAEDTAQLAAASRLFPTYHATAPERSGMTLTPKENT